MHTHTLCNVGWCPVFTGHDLNLELSICFSSSWCTVVKGAKQVELV